MAYEDRNASRKLSCQVCGATFEASPPDDIRTIASISGEDLVDEIKIKYKCANHMCQKENEIYWGKRHL